MNTPTLLRGNLDASLAHDHGYRFGAAGLSRDCNPYDPFDPLCVSWDEGWADGRDTRLA